MKPQVFTVHAKTTDIEDLITQLEESAKDRMEHGSDNEPELVIKRLKENLQYNSSPAIPFLTVSKKDVKILLDLLDKEKKED